MEVQACMVVVYQDTVDALSKEILNPSYMVVSVWMDADTGFVKDVGCKVV